MSNSKITKELIIEQIYNLGIKQNDIVFISADLMRVGFFNKNVDTTKSDWSEIFKHFVNNDNVTFCIPAYTQTYWLFNKKNITVFNNKTKTTSGVLSEVFSDFPDVVRSKHPTHSVYSVGPNKNKIIHGHDHRATCYLPYRTILELGGKNLMLGSLDTHNSPITFHLAQEILGHTFNHPYSNLRCIYFMDDSGEKLLFKRPDVGGCTGGGHKTIGRHINANAINISTVGRSYSAYIDIKKSLNIMLETFVNHPTSLKCDNYSCVSCYGRFRYNGVNVIVFWFKKILKLIKR